LVHSIYDNIRETKRYSIEYQQIGQKAPFTESCQQLHKVQIGLSGGPYLIDPWTHVSTNLSHASMFTQIPRVHVCSRLPCPTMEHCIPIVTPLPTSRYPLPCFILCLPQTPHGVFCPVTVILLDYTPRPRPTPCFHVLPSYASSYIYPRHLIMHSATPL
jgi:hypothetical protein